MKFHVSKDQLNSVKFLLTILSTIYKGIKCIVETILIISETYSPISQSDIGGYEKKPAVTTETN